MRPQRGVALLVVLWACTLLAILVGGFASIARVEALQTRFTLGQQHARYAAEAGVMQAIAAISAYRRQVLLASMVETPGQRTPMPGDGRRLAMRFEQMHVDVAIADETGKVDINRADERTLVALFVAAGCSQGRAETLKDQVEAWRGRVPFTAIEQMQSLPAMDADLYTQLEPAITVLSGQAAPEPNFAPLLALATLRGVDLATAREVLAARDSVPAGTPLPNLPGGISLGDALPGHAFTFRATADDGHGAHATVEATVLFAIPAEQRAPDEPLYTIVRWRDGVSS
jgi:general secretion pathway protein K